MIARKHRFHGHNSVNKTRGPIARSPLFNIVNNVNYKRTDYRLAIVVSRKISKKAVVRNKIRRRIYESVRFSGVLDDQNRDVVIIIRDEKIATMSYQELHDKLVKQLHVALKSLPKNPHH